MRIWNAHGSIASLPKENEWHSNAICIRDYFRFLLPVGYASLVLRNFGFKYTDIY